MTNVIADIKRSESGLKIDIPSSIAQIHRFAFRPFNDRAGLVRLVEVSASGPIPRTKVAVYARRDDSSWYTNYSDNGALQRKYGPETDESKCMQALVDQF